MDTVRRWQSQCVEYFISTGELTKALGQPLRVHHNNADDDLTRARLTVGSLRKLINKHHFHADGIFVFHLKRIQPFAAFHLHFLQFTRNTHTHT